MTLMVCTLTTGHIYQGDALEVLKGLPDESVQTCVTSPPYWGLRDYGKDGQIGLELTPEEYVAKLVDVFREVRRVLRKDGTLWLNLGDSYSGSGKSPAGNLGASHNERWLEDRHSAIIPDGLKPKDLVGIPWRVAFALQADGWYLRQDIIWAKPNPIPESVTDRCTKSHEYIFLLAKSQRYYYDNEAVREEPKPWNNGVMRAPKCGSNRPNIDTYADDSGNVTIKQYDEIKGANRRSVWQIATKPYSGAHFAVYPEELIEPCILAGSPEGGIVLDPFFGSGTTGAVSARLGRRWIGIELNPEYIKLAIDRMTPHDKQPLLFGIGG